MSGPLVPISARPLLALTLPALSVSTAVSVRTDELAANCQLQFPPEPTVAVPTVASPLRMVTVATASPVPESIEGVPPVNIGAPGATVSMVTDSAEEAALTLPATSVAWAVML